MTSIYTFTMTRKSILMFTKTQLSDMDSQTDKLQKEVGIEQEVSETNLEVVSLHSQSMNFKKRKINFHKSSFTEFTDDKIVGSDTQYAHKNIQTDDIFKTEQRSTERTQKSSKPLYDRKFKSRALKTHNSTNKNLEVFNSEYKPYHIFTDPHDDIDNEYITSSPISPHNVTGISPKQNHNEPFKSNHRNFPYQLSEIKNKLPSHNTDGNSPFFNNRQFKTDGSQLNDQDSIVAEEYLKTQELYSPKSNRYSTRMPGDKAIMMNTDGFFQPKVPSMEVVFDGKNPNRMRGFFRANQTQKIRKKVKSPQETHFTYKSSDNLLSDTAKIYPHQSTLPQQSIPQLLSSSVSQQLKKDLDSKNELYNYLGLESVAEKKLKSRLAIQTNNYDDYPLFTPELEKMIEEHNLNDGSESKNRLTSTLSQRKQRPLVQIKGLNHKKLHIQSRIIPKRRGSGHERLIIRDKRKSEPSVRIKRESSTQNGQRKKIIYSHLKTTANNFKELNINVK